ncbi:GNAT family N-acetyltransferase [Chitinimonas naiadis]
MQMRPAVAADATAISQLIRSLSPLLTLTPDGAGAEGFFATISTEAIAGYIAAPNFSYWLAEEAGVLAGVVAIRDQRHLYHLFVAPAFQGKGLGRQMWEAASHAALLAGNPGGFTVNASLNAVPVYERFGFRVNGPKVETHGVAFVPMLRMLEIAGLD